MLSDHKNIFIVGIKGVAMTNLARILTQMGKTVAGSDTAESFITDELLSDTDVIVLPSFSPMLIPDKTDLVIYSAAHEGKHNPQVEFALKKGIKVLHQAEVLGEMIEQFETSVAISGCHGKTTTAALLAYTLKQLGEKPSYMVGVSDFNDEPGGEYAEKKHFVVEADEYGLNPPEDITPKFHLLHPDHALVLNIDYDHPDVYKNLDETKAAFKTFIDSVVKKKETSRVFACIDDDPLKEVLTSVPAEKIVTYGFDLRSDYAIKEVKTTSQASVFTLQAKNIQEPIVVTVKLFGEKNVSNAAGVIAYLLHIGFDPAKVVQAISGFIGAKRRFEFIEKYEEMYLFDDYGHHPNEITATIQAARARFPNSKIIVLFQPHTFSRTQHLKNEFVDALKQADVSILLPIFASAREKGEDTISSTQIVEEAKKLGITNLTAVETLVDLEQVLYPHLVNNSVIFTMGAGDVYKLRSKIIPLMHQVNF